MGDLGNTITNNVASIAMAVIFIWYLNKKDSAFERMMEEFAEKLQHLADALYSLEKRVDAVHDNKKSSRIN